MIKSFLFALPLALTTAVQAGPISFAQGWSVQKLSLFSNNTYTFGKSLTLHSDDSVSIAWKALPQSEWGASSAAWGWSVSQSVLATQLTTKGGDDRNLAFYFVFAPQDQAPQLKGKNIRELLGNNDIRVLIYTWGGDHKRGERFGSPYLKGQGENVILRSAGTGTFNERVNLDKDYKAAFGSAPKALVGLAVSGDSDDTDGQITAQMSSVVLQ